MAKRAPAKLIPGPLASHMKCSGPSRDRGCGPGGCGRTLCAGCGDHLTTCQDRHAAAAKSRTR